MPSKSNRVPIYSDTDNTDSNETAKKVVPGHRTYSETLKGEKKATIFSTSITKGIKASAFNQDYENGKAQFQLFRGKKAMHIKHYIKSHLEEEVPDQVLIHEGGNDLPDPIPINDLAHHIIEAGEISRRYGVKEVYIAGVTARPGLQRRCYKLNDMLEQLCKKRNFIYVNNDNISLSHLYDGVHIGDAGSKILAKNYLQSLMNSRL